MSATDAAFQAQVVADAVALGWPRNVAQALAKHIGKRVPKPRRTPAPQAKASGVSLDRAVQMFALPAAVASQFRSAGVMTAESAAPLLRTYFRASVRNPASAEVALRVHLLSRRIYGTKGNS